MGRVSCGAGSSAGGGCGGSSWVRCGEVDEAARSMLRTAGLEKAFSHSTGHGVGLGIHEGPRIAATQEQVLEAGMVITIEPGAYLTRGTR